MIQTRFIIELKENKNSLKGFPKVFLSEVSKILERSGIQCGSIKKKNTVFYVICVREKKKCEICMYESYSVNADSKIQFYVFCSNTFSFWKRMFNRYSEENYFEGDFLRDVVTELCSVLKSDSRVASFILVDKHEWVDFLRNVKESYFFDCPVFCKNPSGGRSQ